MQHLYIYIYIFEIYNKCFQKLTMLHQLHFKWITDVMNHGNYVI